MVALWTAAMVWAPVNGEDAAAAKKEESKATTIGDPEIPIDELVWLLQPLRKAELIVEAEAWIGIVQKKVVENANVEVAVKRKNVAIDESADIREAVDEVKEAVEGGEKIEAASKAVERAEDKAKETEARNRGTGAAKTVDDGVEKAVEEAIIEAEKKKAAAGEKTTKLEAPAAVTTEATAKPPVIKAEDLKDTAKLQKAAEAAEDAERATVEMKSKLLDSLNTLRTQRAKLVERTRVVLDALEKKGGDVEEYRLYIQSIPGISLDVTDASATYAAVKGWITSPAHGIKYAKNLGVAVLYLFLFLFLSKMAAKMAERALRATQRASTLLRDFFVKAIRRTIVVVGLIMVASALGIQVGPVLALIGAAGFVVAFALQDTLGNFASGLLIMFYRPFNVGDVVDAGGVSGKVESVTLTSTHVRTFDNKAVIVPNNSVWGNVITNATGTGQRRVDMVFGIGYEDDIAVAQKILEEIITEHSLVLKDPEPVIKLHELADSSVNFVCRPWTRTADYWTVYWDVTRSVKERFDQEGVSIPFPQRDVHVYQTTPTTRPGTEGPIRRRYSCRRPSRTRPSRRFRGPVSQRGDAG